jgi:hypothetical protein
MATAYVKPPKFILESLIAEDEFVISLGTISMREADGKQSGDFAMVRCSNKRLSLLRWQKLLKRPTAVS